MIPKKTELTKGLVDLHTHSYFSDGSFSPEQIIQYASDLGLKAISITDHDSIDAIPIALQISKKCHIEFIPGIEISAKHGAYDLHLLGYFMDHNNEQLRNYVKLFQNERRKRAEKIVKLLNKVGVKIKLEFVLHKAAKGSVGRPHIAEVMVEQGYVFSYQEAFQKYIGDGCSCYVPKYKIKPTSAVQLINEAGGISFIAHPGVDLNEEGILELIKLGIEGIETIHPKHCPHDIDYYRRLVKKHNILECGGSDCHGERKGETLIGQFTVPYQIIINMKNRLKHKS